MSKLLCDQITDQSRKTVIFDNLFTEEYNFKRQKYAVQTVV